MARITKDVAGRLEEYSMPEPNSGCQIWIGAANLTGYGHMKIRGKSFATHRVAYEIFKCEEIPEGMQIDHLCRVRCCINPQHMEVVTGAENIRRGVPFRTRKPNKGKLVCKRGHAVEGDNEYVNPLGHRICKECSNMAGKKYREANPEKNRARVTAYAEANKDKRAAYREANKDSIREAQAAHYAANKEKMKANMRAYYHGKRAERLAQTSNVV